MSRIACDRSVDCRVGLAWSHRPPGHRQDARRGFYQGGCARSEGVVSSQPPYHTPCSRPQQSRLGPASSSGWLPEAFCALPRLTACIHPGSFGLLNDSRTRGHRFDRLLIIMDEALELCSTKPLPRSSGDLGRPLFSFRSDDSSMARSSSCTDVRAVCAVPPSRYDRRWKLGV